MALPMFIHAQQIAALMGLSTERAFLSQREALVREKGFPQAMPFSKRPLLWRQDQVMLWLNQQGLPQATVPPQVMTGGNVHLLHRARQV